MHIKINRRRFLANSAAGGAGLLVLPNSLSARTYQRVRRVARTIADLAGSEDIRSSHLAEALALRQLDKKRRY